MSLHDTLSKETFSLPVFISHTTGAAVSPTSPTTTTTSSPLSPSFLKSFSLLPSASSDSQSQSSSTHSTNSTRPTSLLPTKRISAVIDTKRLSLALDSVLDTWDTILRSAESFLNEDELDGREERPRRRRNANAGVMSEGDANQSANAGRDLESGGEFWATRADLESGAYYDGVRFLAEKGDGGWLD